MSTPTISTDRALDYLREDNADAHALVTEILTAAEAHIRSLCIDYLDVAGDWDTLPDPLQMAVLILTVHWYDIRAAVSDRTMTEIPMTVSALIANYRDWDGDDDTA